MPEDVITIYIAIPAAIAVAILGFLGYRTKKRTAERRKERLKQRWPREPFV